MISEVKEKCALLGLKSFESNLDEVLDFSNLKNWSTLKILDHLLSLEMERKRRLRIESRFKSSRLIEKLTLDSFDFDHHGSRKKQKNVIKSLTNPEFIKQKKDVILIGNPGVGKTFIAKCIGYQATQESVKVLFTTAIEMINQLVAAEADHSLLKKLKTYQSPDLLICDELGYLPLGGNGSNLFFQVISARHQQKSTLITTNLSFADWGNIFDNTTVATAIADRLVNNSEILLLEGKSYRQK